MTITVTPNVKTLTELLDIKGPPFMVDLKQAILQEFDNPKELRKIIDRQCEYREQTHCYACNNEACCLILKGVVRLALEEVDIALKEIESANRNFRTEDETWNQIIGLALIAIAHEKNRKDHLAFRELEKACNLLINGYQPLNEKDYEERVTSLMASMEEWMDRLNPHSTSKTTPKPASTRFSISWIPVYTGLQAGPNGPIWTGPLPESEGAFASTVILEDKPHRIFSLRQGDHMITTVSSRSYGWAKVSGDSMNGSKPVPILENDFVLFYHAEDANDNAIVIASRTEISGAGYRYNIKRYQKNERLLISETDPPGLYQPIRMDRDTKIIGVAIAVAKQTNWPD